MPIQSTDITETTFDGIDFDSPFQTWAILAGLTVSTVSGFGVNSAEFESGLLNFGTILSEENYAVRFAGDFGTITNTASGVIVGEGGITVSSTTTVINHGTIAATGDEEGGGGVGINIEGVAGEIVHIKNSGILSGNERAIFAITGGIHLTNSGLILDLIDLNSETADTLRNCGTIFGRVLLGDGDDRFDGRGGVVHDIVFGEEGDDRLIGGDGDDVFAGGHGIDVITGGAGADTFVFSASLGAENADRIRDFSVRDDTMHLDSNVFLALGGPGALAASMFQLGKEADDADDFILYNRNTGALKHDANGDDAGGVTLIAKLAPGLKLTHLDFEVI